MMTRSFTTFLVLAGVAACGVDARPPSLQPRTITGTATFVTFDEAGGATTFPLPLHETIVSAQSPFDEGWTVVEGIGHADGTFEIDGVADRDYWLEVYDAITGNRQFLWTDADRLTFEERGNGRGDAVAAKPNTTLTFGSIPGLDPVQADDALLLTSGNLGLSEQVFGALSVDATTLDSTRRWAGQPLISAAKHDAITLAQVRTSVDASSGITYRSTIASASFDAIEQLDGRDTRVTGAFSPPPDFTFELRWQRSAFVAAAADVHPTRVGPLAQATFDEKAMPGGSATATSPFAATVLYIDPSFVTDTTDLAVPFAIKNPYPASWLYGEYAMAFPVTLPVPGIAGASITDASVVQVVTNDLPSADHPIVPLVTPPLQPTVNDQDLFADRDGVGLIPVIGWSPPARGTPTAYAIEVKRWDVEFQSVGTSDAGVLIVPGDVTRVRLPAHVLEPGGHYYLHIVAIVQAGQDVRTRSTYTQGLPYGTAELVTNTFSP